MPPALLIVEFTPDMSEPSSFTTLIHMTRDAYVRLMRGKALEPLADSVVQIVTDGLKDIVVFKYLKKEQALFAHYYFHYSQALDTILGHPAVSALLHVSEFKDTETPDRAVVSHDANNFKESEPSAGFVLEQGAVHRNDAFDAATIDAFDLLITMHFHKFAGDFGEEGAHWLWSTRIVDSRLRRKIERRLEAHRLRIAKERIPKATPLQPVRLCSHYHYNGRFVLFYAPGYELRPLPGIDPHTFRQRDYGAADAEHIAVGGRLLRTDPARFKMLRKGETTFYVGADCVYDKELTPIPGADPKTFKLVHDAFARDEARWYTARGIPLNDVGERARVEDSLYYYDLSLLLGERSVYLGDHRLPLHGSSCRFVRTQQLRRDPYYGGLMWFTDEEGDCIVSRMGRFSKGTSLNITRTPKPEAVWEEENARWESLATDPASASEALNRDAQKNLDSDDARRAFIAFFEDWLSIHFDPCWRDDPYSWWVWDGIEKYFDCLLGSGEYRRIIDLYEKIESEAWCHPEIFHHTARAFLALGQVDRAVEDIRRAVIYSYSGADKLFARPELANLLRREDVSQLRAYLEFLDGLPRPGRPLPGDLARHFLNAIPEQLQPKAGHIFQRFFIPGAAFRSALRQTDPARATAYEQTLAAFVNRCMLSESARRSAAYNARQSYPAWGDLPGLHPVVHLIAASELYAEGFFWVDMNPDKPTRPE